MRFGDLFFPFLVFLPLLFLQDERFRGVPTAISKEDLLRHVRSLPHDRNPLAPPQLDRAAEYILNEFRKTDLEVREDRFEWQGALYRNIVAERRGTSFPDRIVIIGSHYDTVPGSPGADDNASATAVLLEVAHHLKGIRLDYTVRLIAFCLEELDFVGSAHHARRAKENGEDIQGMISLEMVGFTGPNQRYPSYINPKEYPNTGDFIAVIGNERSKKLLDRVRRCVASVPGLPAEFLVVPGCGEQMEEVTLSDHRSFWQEGFPALMMTDTGFLRNPNYHLPSDTIETLDFDFMAKVAAAAFCSVLELASIR
jgi:aminopeptidase YwaD